VIFNKARATQFLQVINMATYWIHTWLFILSPDQLEHMDSKCTQLMAVVRAIFTQGGWQCANMIHDA
jgi:hypothetical protein